MSSTSRSLETSVIRKRLTATKPTQEGIQGAAYWMLAHKQQFHQIIHEWLAVLKASKPDRCLTLFYICNEIVQTCKRKNALAYKDAYHAILKEAISYARNASIVANIERILRIWHERNVYSSDFLNELIYELKGESAQLNPSVQLPELIDALKHNQKVDVDLEMKRSSIVNVNLDMTSQQIAKLFKDRQQGKALSNQIEECKQSIQEYMHLSNQSSTDRSLLIDQLESAFQVYEAQYAESKIVVNAYKNFGARIRHLRNKLQTRMKTLPPPSEILPSDTQPIDMELSDGEDNGSVIEVKEAETKLQQIDTYIETLTSPPSSPQANNNSDISSTIIPTLPTSKVQSSASNTPALLSIESIPLPPAPPSFLIKASKSNSYNPYTTTQASVGNTSGIKNNQSEAGLSIGEAKNNNEKDFGESFKSAENRNDEVVHEPLNERIERILNEGNEKEKISENLNLKDINPQKPSINDVKPSISCTIQNSNAANMTSKQQSDNLINNIDINLLKNILQNTRKPILTDPDPIVPRQTINSQNDLVYNENNNNNNNRDNIISNNENNINFKNNNNNSYDLEEAYVPKIALKMQVKEYNHTKVDENDFNPHAVNPPPGKLISPQQFLNLYKSHDANHEEENRFFSDSDEFVKENGVEVVEDFEKGMPEQQQPSNENVEVASNYYSGNPRNDDYYNEVRNPDNHPHNYPPRNFRYASRPFTPRTPPAPFRQRPPVFFTPRPFRPPNRFHSPHFPPQQRFQRAKFNRFHNAPS